MAPARKVMRPDGVRRELEASLRRLGLDEICLYQVHWPGDGRLLTGVGVGDEQPSDLATPLEEYWALMADLKAEGKVRAIGLSNHDVAQLEIAESIAHIDVLQPPFSALHRSAAPEIAWCAAHGTGVIVYSPMASGLLTGAFDHARAHALPADDWRHAHPDFTDHLDANLEVVATLREIADRRDVPVSTVAVAWTLAWPGITAAIVGARHPDQISAWASAGSFQLGEGDLDTVAQALTRTGAGTGPTRPPHTVTHR